MAKDVTLLTGFLGSGKTTLLNALMADRPATRFALIENEFGEEGIDGGLVIRPDVDVVELSDGCLCCSLNDELFEVLEALYFRRNTFDELIIETTGIADPAGVAMPFLMMPLVIREFSLKRVICLVDAELIEDQLRDTEEAIKQISFSDIILLNKIDRVSPAYVDRLTDILRGLNPFARVLTGAKDGYPIDELLSLERAADPIPDRTHDHSHAHKHPTPVLAPEPARERPLGTLPHQHAGPQHHHHAHSDIVSLSFRFTDDFDMHELHHRLLTLVLFQGEGIYRIKGIISAHGIPRRLVIQSVGKTIAITEGADWQPDEERISRVVFIGKLLKPAGFEKLLKHCLAKTKKTGQWQIMNSATLLSTPKL